MRSSQCGFTKGQSCLTNLVAFYRDISRWMDDYKAMDVVYLDSSETFDVVSHSSLAGKLRQCSLGDWGMRWV